MKSIFLSVVVIAALAVAGIGGTLAGWSDTEESFDNYITTGSLDLKVQRTDDKPWGDGIPVVTAFTDIVPSYIYKTNIIVANYGQGNPPPPSTATLSAPLYIMFKDFACSNVDPTCGTGYEWPATSNLWKPEPELVAEYGGVLAQTHIVAANASVGNWGSLAC